ncbi:hypothetical protein NHQ30_006872 [Ciborinia camelliae]|nr:hypothetical protein NHQ30_006872 [Ciborinia camelliae]
MSSDIDEVFQEAVKGVQAAKSLVFSDYVNRLHNKVRGTFGRDNPYIYDYIPTAPPYPEDQDPNDDTGYIDIFYIPDLLNRLSIPSVASGIANVEDKYDDSDHLKQYVSDDNSKIRYLECVTNLMGFCFGEHLNRELDSQSKPNMEYLWNYPGFRDSCNDLVTSRRFVVNELRTDMARGDHFFSIAWLMIADYMQDRDHVYRTTPSALVTDYQQRASCHVLSQWSYTLWGEYAKGDPDETDNIVKFCGQIATIGLCPPNDITNIQQPAPTWDVTKTFYDMAVSAFDDEDYTKELKDSLSRLKNQQDIVNAWQSYCTSMASLWDSQILPIWHSGMTNAFIGQEYAWIQEWEGGAYISQEDDYQWGQYYLPVISEPGLSTFNQSPKNIVLPGTPIALSNGESRPIEAISSGDRVLVCKQSNSSVLGFCRPVRESLKADLVGFNGEVPWTLSSQVFHTSTGLRAVDPEQAQHFNPYRRIGKLATGHVLFRLQGNEYIAVEIKSIEKTKQCVLEGAFNLLLPGNSQTYHADGYLVDTNAPHHTLRETVEMLRKVPGDKRLGLLSHCQELRNMFGKFEVQAIYQRLNWELFGQYNSPDGKEHTFLKSTNPLDITEHMNTIKALKVIKGIPIDRLTRGFRLKAHHPDRLPAGYELPTLSLIDGYLLVNGEVHPRNTYDSRKRQFRWTRELEQTNLFEHGVFKICPKAIVGQGVIYLSSEEEDQEVPQRDEVHTFEAKACSLDRLAGSYTSSSGDDDNWEPFCQWQVTMDKSVYPPDDQRTDPQEPIDAGTYEDGYYDGEIVVPAIKLLQLDTLRDQINQKFGQQLGSYYDASSTFKGSDQIHSVQFNRATLVPFISDTGLDVNKTWSVGFKSNLDIDITLPALFPEMTLTIDGGYDFFTGFFYEYDPTKRGYKGERHFIKGKNISSATVTAGRSKISRAYELVSKPGETHLSNNKLQPAKVTESLLGLSDDDKSVQNLIDFETYDEKSLHDVTQGYIHKMMYCHMDDTQREKILQVVKPSVPDDLPANLADNLPSNLKTFFKEKYGPAFICRYVGRTQKYMSSFTDQEMKNLWYWWQGNGKNSLSQSEEYNDINRFSSRVAMYQTYKDKLDPYLNDQTQDWASNLYDSISSNTGNLNRWTHFPMQDGNNVVNKMCNILDALDSSKTTDWAQNFFTTFMTFALKHGGKAANLEPGDQDSKYQWLHDSLKDLIEAILNDDPTISKAVQDALLKDITDFEEQNDLDQQADAKTRAAAILEKSTIFVQELSTWFSYIGKGLQTAFGGTALWKWVGQAFDQAAEKFTSSLPAVGMLKGISSICMVGVSLAIAAVSIWGLVTNWNDLSNPQRAVVIIEVVRMVVGGVDKAIDAFKNFKSKPASTPTDDFNMEALNDGLADEIAESSDKLQEVAQDITGDEDYRVAIADGIHGDGVPTESGEETWNEDIGDLTDDIPPGYEDLASKFNISGNVLRMLNAILGVGLVVAMSFSLATNWSSMSDTEKVLGVLNIIVQGLTVFLDIIDVGASAGLWAVTGALSAALPILGAVLAVIGIVLMIVQLFINLFVKKQSPPDPIADFIKDKAHSLISTFDIAPQPQLTYTISASQATAGEVKAITITGENKSSSDVTISHTTITLYSGDDGVCLFRNGADNTDKIVWVADTDPDKDKNGHTYVTPRSTAGSQLPNPSKLGTESNYYEYDLQAAGPPAETSSSLTNLVLKAGEAFQSIWTGKINNKGDDKEKSTSWIEVIEVGLKDTCQIEFVFLRV